MAGVPKDFAVTEYHRAVGRGYRDAKGNLIHSWMSYVKAAHNTNVSIKAEQMALRKAEGRPLPGKTLIARCIDSIPVPEVPESLMDFDVKEPK